MFTLRGGMSRSKYGLLHPGLFSKAMGGTKHLVEEYNQMICLGLDFVCNATVMEGDEPIPSDARLAFFNETRHAYGRTAMLLSGGAALGFYHAGVVKALLENNLMPRVIGGASAGSILCAMIGTRTDDEMFDGLFQVKGTNAPGHYGKLALDFFRPQGYHNEMSQRVEGDKTKYDLLPPMGFTSKKMGGTTGIWNDLKRAFVLLTPSGLRWVSGLVTDVLTGQMKAKDMLMNDTKHFRRCCRINIGEFTFQEAFDRTGRILNITVSPQNRSDPPRLLNYLTAPHVLVWSAAVASSALPGVFEASKLWVKDSDGNMRLESSSGARFQDGSMENDLPMQQLGEMFNVNHFIISQVNPHAYMLSSLSGNTDVWSNTILGFASSLLSFLKNEVKAWIRNVVEFAGGRRLAPLWELRRGFFTQLLTQEYEGRDCDITINPWVNHRSLISAFLHCIYNPTNEDFMEWQLAAEKETWKFLPMIKTHGEVEVKLDKCVQKLRKKIITESRERKLNAADGNVVNGLGKRVPSFYTSPSLVNLSGLGIADQPLLTSSAKNSIQNDSSSDLADGGPITMDSGSEDGNPGRNPPSSPKSIHSAPDPDESYTKTTSMAAFYYRKNRSNEQLHKSDGSLPSNFRSKYE
eukprot:CAMPEP_0118656336 /NCGR_PEP_ID=MMETSP0785-20121206/13438_1 /TAXON_ID=91992 /ORGANISM="Bolidomonas pacifica, Strain CCMP 1866" /LENGTH=633 /DNA_ID=CAMNT_0006549195 /DNA_START=379 /DNA_END=2280 /DNA_ORIENTATION=+